MLFNHQIKCDTRNEFDIAIEEAYQLCLKTNWPMRIMGHCSSLGKDGDGRGGIFFGLLNKENGKIGEIIYSVSTEFPIDREVFDINWELEHRLRIAGKMIGYSDWEEYRVTHVVTIPWNNHGWEYGMISTDTNAILSLLKFHGTTIKRGKLQLDDQSSFA